MDKINWGIIGLGEIAKAHSNSFLNAKNCKLKAIASRTETKIRDFNKIFNIEKKFCFNDYDNLINNAEIDIVYISLPNIFHHEWIEKCIENEKNILVEKPITTNAYQIKKIQEKVLFKNSKISIFEGFMYKYHPQILKILELIKNDEIGEINHIESSFGINLFTKKKFWFFEKKKKINKKGRLFNKNLGGGCILDLGCYPISFITMISDLIENTKGSFEIINKKIEIGETDVDVDASIELVLRNKINAKLFSSFKKNLGTTTKIYGTKGKIEITNTWTGSSNIIVKTKNKHNVINFCNVKDIYILQLEKISDKLINNKVNQNFDNMILNMEIIDKWLN